MLPPSKGRNDSPTRTGYPAKYPCHDQSYIACERKHKDNILFENISNSGNIFPDETRRLIYVALSRPKYLLAMAFPDSIKDIDLKKKFGEAIKIVTQEELI